MNRRETALVTAVLLLLLAVTAWRLRGPAPAGPDAPAGGFSAARATSLLGELLREGVPHPVGTPANRAVRDRIEARFRALGFTTEIQPDFVCSATPNCATVENIVAMTPGDPGPYVLLVAHYDSVAAGPGASDAGVPVAALLEIARALGPLRGLAFLITDGEEAGLLGAEAFVKRPLRERVTAVVNVDNRGASGPAFLFETGRGNAGLMPAVRSIDRPFASSLFYTIYDLLPNDTDASVFKRAGMQVLNFGAIGDVAWYHTPLDDLAHVNPRTVQHYGDSVLSVTRGLLRGVRRTPGNAVFFDVLGLGLVWWPEQWTLWIATASLILLVVGSRGESWKAIATGAALMVLTIVAAAGLAFVLVWLAHLRAGSAGRLAYPQAVIAAMWMGGLTAALLVFRIPRGREIRAVDAGVGLVWHVAAMALALTLPGTAFLFLIPALAFSLGALFRARPVFAALIASIAAGALLLPVMLFLYTALGKTSLVAIAIIASLIATTVVPLIGGRPFRAAVATAGMAIAASVLTLLLPTFTAERPRRAPIDHELQQPTVDAAVSRSDDVVTIRVASQRAADRVMLEFEDRVDVLRINGIEPAARNPRRRIGRGGVTVYGREAEVEVRAPAGMEVVASDLTYGLPPAAGEEAARRDAANSVTSHRGDVTVSRVKVGI